MAEPINNWAVHAGELVARGLQTAVQEPHQQRALTVDSGGLSNASSGLWQTSSLLRLARAVVVNSQTIVKHELKAKS